MQGRVTPHRGRPAALYEALVAILGWGVLLWVTVTAHAVVAPVPLLLYLLLAVVLKREGFRVARPVTHSLAGVAVLASVLALDHPYGAWVAALSGALFLATRFPGADGRGGLGRWRQALFGGGLNALMALGGGAIYRLLGGRLAPAPFQWPGLVPLGALSLAWFLGDHAGWCLRIAFEEGLAGAGRFLRTVLTYSVAVELLPLPLAAVVAASDTVLGAPAFALLAIFLVAVGAVLRWLYATLGRARERVADLTTLNTFGQALLASKLDVADLCRVLRNHTAAIAGDCCIWLGLFDPSSGRLEPAPSTAAGGSGENDLAPGQGLVEWMRKHRAPLLLRDAGAEALPFPSDGELRFRSALFVPLQASGGLIGLLTVQSRHPGVYSEDALRTVVTFANQTAMAIQNARAIESEQRRARQLAIVGEVSRRVVAILGMEQLFAEVVSLIQGAFGYYDVQLFTVDQHTGLPEFRASTNPAIQQRGVEVAAGQGLVGWVAQTGQELVVDDVAAEPRYRLIEGLENARAEVVVPLKVDERLVGILDVQSDRRAAFGQDDVFVLRTLADQMAIAIEDNRLYRAERSRRQLADTLREIANALNSTLELHAVLDLVLTQLSHVIRYEAAAILKWQEGHLCIVAGRGPRYASPDRCLAAQEDAQLRRLTADSQPIVFGGASSESAAGEPLSLAAALQVKGRLIGALTLEREGPAAQYGEEEIQVVSTFANQAASAIENAQLYAAQQEEAWVSTALLQVAEALANLIGIDEVLDAIISLVPLVVGVDRCIIFLRDEDAGACRAVRAHGLSGPEREALLARTLEELAPNLWQAVQQSPAPIGLDALAPALGGEVQQALGLSSGVALPLRAGGETIGALAAGDVQPAGAPNRNRRAILTGIANQAAMAIRNAHLYAAQRQEAWVSTALLQVSELAGRTRDLDEILGGLVRLTPMLVGVDRCWALLWDRAQRRYLFSQVYGLREDLRERMRGLSFEVGEFPLLDRVRETGGPLAVEEVAGSELVPAALAEATEMASVLALPLRSQGDILGIMLVDYAGRPRRFPEQRVALLSGIANQAAVAIENYRLYRESLEGERIAQELRVARQIQATFLPEQAPRLPGWSIAVTSRPAREVGGDFYDFVPLGVDRLGLVIADVSDKGVPAALFMALSRTIMRAVAGERNSPAATLARVNELLLADSRSGMFVTLFYGILDTRSGELVYSSAGHNPPYWCGHANGGLVRLASRGIALGAVAQPVFEEERITMVPGDALVLYTDGVTESFDAGDNGFGEDGLEEAIRQASGAPAEQLMAAINRAVQSFVGAAPQSDDYTLLAIRRDA